MLASVSEGMEARLARLEEKVRNHDNVVAAVAALPIEMARAVVRLDNAIEDLDDTRSECREIHAEVRDEITKRSASRTQIVIALIGASAIVIAALVTAIVALTGHA
jgi:DNA repair ATPase RecN